MNICFLEGDMSRNGGTERMTAWVANQLSNENKIHIVSLRMDKEESYYKLQENITHFCVESHGENGFVGLIKAIRSYLKSEKIDCVINVDTGIGIYGILASKGLHIKVITWEHSNYFNNWNSRIFPYLRKFAAKFSDSLVVLTEKDKNNYLSHVKLKTPIEVIPNPIERHLFKYDTESKVIVSVGHLSNVKRFDRVIELGKQVFVKHPDWSWRIYGKGPEKENLECLIKKNGLENNIILMGVERDLEKIYGQAAFLVMTSDMEGLPMVLLEAKSYGLPLISFDIMTGPSDIVSDGENGFLVPAYDLDKMSKEIVCLMENQDIRKSFSENSVLNMEKFDEKGVMRKWERLIKVKNL